MDSPIKSNIPRVEITIQKISNEEKKKKKRHNYSLCAIAQVSVIKLASILVLLAWILKPN
jgi:hypothetical protein